MRRADGPIIAQPNILEKTRPGLQRNNDSLWRGDHRVGVSWDPLRELNSKTGNILRISGCLRGLSGGGEIRGPPALQLDDLLEWLVGDTFRPRLEKAGGLKDLKRTYWDNFRIFLHYI